MVLVWISQGSDQPLGVGEASNTAAQTVAEQEGIWESDISPPEAWERVVQRPQASSPHRPPRHQSRPSVDKSGEVWEDDLYSPEAWIYGVEKLDQAAYSEQEQTHEEVFWPNIERYISRPSGSRPVVTCVICQISRLVIEGLQERKDGAAQEDHVVLPCGHVIGKDCFYEWEAVAAHPVKCPVCNAVVD